MWTPQTLFESDSYDDLITGKIPALIVPEILSKTECSSLCNRITNNQTTNGNPRRFGTSLSSHIYEKSKYFSNAQRSNDSLKKLFAENISPLIAMRNAISKKIPKATYYRN